MANTGDGIRIGRWSKCWRVQVLEWTGHGVKASGSPKPPLSLC